MQRSAPASGCHLRKVVVRNLHRMIEIAIPAPQIEEETSIALRVVQLGEVFRNGKSAERGGTGRGRDGGAGIQATGRSYKTHWPGGAWRGDGGTRERGGSHCASHSIEAHGSSPSKVSGPDSRASGCALKSCSAIWWGMGQMARAQRKKRRIGCRSCMMRILRFTEKGTGGSRLVKRDSPLLRGKHGDCARACLKSEAGRPRRRAWPVGPQVLRGQNNR